MKYKTNERRVFMLGMIVFSLAFNGYTELSLFGVYIQYKISTKI